MVQLIKEHKVLILAAGYGSRMKQYGENFPKCLLKYNNKSLLDYIIEHLIKLGVNDINIALGYKSNKIILSLKKYKNIKFTFYKVDDYKTVGSAFSWYLFEKIWNKDKKPLMVMHADIFFQHELINKIFYSKQKDIIGTVTKNGKNIKIKGWTVENKRNNLITKVIQKQKDNDLYNREIACINKFSSKTTRLIFLFMKNFFIRNGRNFTWEILLHKIINEKKIKMYTNNYDNYWFNINTIFDYQNLKKHKLK